MKKLHLTAAMVAILGVGAATSAFALSTPSNTGELRFVGEVMQGGTCQVAPGGGVATVTLDRIDASALAAPNSFAATVPFTFVVGGGVADACNGKITRLSFEGGRINADGYLDNAEGTAANIGVRLLNGTTHAPINLLTGENNPQTVPVSGAPGILQYQAQYYSKTGQVTGGTVATYVIYTVSY